MRVGNTPQDIIDIVSIWIDILDCVVPTRLARNGTLYNGKLKIKQRIDNVFFESKFVKGRLNISNNWLKLDQGPIQKGGMILG